MQAIERGIAALFGLIDLGTAALLGVTPGTWRMQGEELTTVARAIADLDKSTPKLAAAAHKALAPAVLVGTVVLAVGSRASSTIQEVKANGGVRPFRNVRGADPGAGNAAGGFISGSDHHEPSPVQRPWENAV
ncbi:MAG: hypothetical protein ACYCSN_14660 [Acidobacteriaceae bacterium]